MMTLISRKRASSLALAVALMTGSAVVATAFIPVEANAQRRDRDRNQQAEDGGGYSDAFRAVFVPLDEAMKIEGADVSGYRSQFETLATLLNTNDEKIAGGGLLFNAGVRMSEPSFQLRGMEAMIASGKVPIESLGRYNFIAYQLANQAGDTAKARRYLQSAIDYNFSTETINSSGLKITMAESYFADDLFDDGFNYLNQAISNRKAQGLTVDEQWYRRGVTVAYQNEIVPTVYDMVEQWIADYPNDFTWKESINLTRNLNEFTGPEILDLFRLSRKVNALQEASDYDYYVESADPRRLPKEVKDIITEGLASGVISQSNLYITESLETANARIASDRADLPALEADANAADATLRTVIAAGGAFLSYGEYAKAAGFYNRALGMAGVDTNEALTRLGIAQVGMGDYGAARETFAKVTGNRMPIARLWTSYIGQVENAAPTAASATM